MTSAQTFDDILRTADLPEPGPEYYVARRNLWLTPRTSTASSSSSTPPTSSVSRQKLERLLSQPGAIYKSEVWNNGLDKVWKGISSGGRLKCRMPMHLIVKVIHASWLRDNTWPSGMEPPPDTDEEELDAAKIESKDVPDRLPST